MHRISSFTAKYLWWQWCWENTDSLQKWSMRIISYGIPLKGRYDENRSKEGSREIEKGTERNFILMLNSNISKGKCHPSKDGECTNYSYLERQWDLYEEVTMPCAHEGSEPTFQSLPPTAEDITVELWMEDSPPPAVSLCCPPGSPPHLLSCLHFPSSSPQLNVQRYPVGHTCECTLAKLTQIVLPDWQVFKILNNMFILSCFHVPCLESKTEKKAQPCGTGAGTLRSARAWNSGSQSVVPRQTASASHKTLLKGRVSGLSLHLWDQLLWGDQ